MWNDMLYIDSLYSVIGYLHNLSVRLLFFSWVFQLPFATRNDSLQVLAVLAVEGCYLCSYLSQESNHTVTLFLFSFSSSSVIVVWGAGTPTSPPSPKEQAERAYRKSAHAAPYELHEARSLTRVSVHLAALFWLVCELCFWICLLGVWTDRLGPWGKPFLSTWSPVFLLDQWPDKLPD